MRAIILEFNHRQEIYFLGGNLQCCSKRPFCKHCKVTAIILESNERKGNLFTLMSIYNTEVRGHFVNTAKSQQ